MNMKYDSSKPPTASNASRRSSRHAAGEPADRFLDRRSALAAVVARSTGSTATTSRPARDRSHGRARAGRGPTGRGHPRACGSPGRPRRPGASGWRRRATRRASRASTRRRGWRRPPSASPRPRSPGCSPRRNRGCRRSAAAWRGRPRQPPPARRRSNRCRRARPRTAAWSRSRACRGSGAGARPGENVTTATRSGASRLRPRPGWRSLAGGGVPTGVRRVDRPGVRREVRLGARLPGELERPLVAGLGEWLPARVVVEQVGDRLGDRPGVRLGVRHGVRRRPRAATSRGVVSTGARQAIASRTGRPKPSPWLG